jgi:monoamine oxidase
MSEVGSHDTAVAVIGAGLAGLSATYQLQQAGVDVALYEANPERVGGRCWTERSFFAGGFTAEHGPERIDTEHQAIRDLAAELGLELYDHGSFIVAKEHTVTDDDADASSETIFQTAVREDMARRGIPLGKRPRNRPLSEAEIALDAMSIREWIEATIDGGLASPAAQEVGFELSMGAGRSLDELSAFTLTEFGLEAADERTSDARYQVRGGNSSIPEAVRARLAPGVLTLGGRLTRLAKTGDGYQLEFSTGNSVTAEAVILALPFTALRRVDLTDAGFSDTKLAAIEEFDLGLLSKVLMQFDRPQSDFPDWTGLVYSLEPRVIAMAGTGGQEGESMIVSTFVTGADCEALSNGVAHAPAPEAVVSPLLDVLDREVPGLRDAFTGLAWMDSWVDDEFTFGAYSSFRPGQVARFAHVVAIPEGGVFFAGEHTSADFQGFMNGAVESGQRAAREVLAYIA